MHISELAVLQRDFISLKPLTGNCIIAAPASQHAIPQEFQASKTLLWGLASRQTRALSFSLSKPAETNVNGILLLSQRQPRDEASPIRQTVKWPLDLNSVPIGQIILVFITGHLSRLVNSLTAWIELQLETGQTSYLPLAWKSINQRCSNVQEEHLRKWNNFKSRK